MRLTSSRPLLLQIEPRQLNLGLHYLQLQLLLPDTCIRLDLGLSGLLLGLSGLLLSCLYLLDLLAQVCNVRHMLLGHILVTLGIFNRPLVLRILHDRPIIRGVAAISSHQGDGVLEFLLRDALLFGDSRFLVILPVAPKLCELLGLQ